jgi:transcriptional regulator with XRE-family HTH domain
MTIAERVTQVIEASGLTLDEFARRAGREPSRLRDAVAGQRRFTSLDLALIADFAGVTVS